MTDLQYIQENTKQLLNKVYKYNELSILLKNIFNKSIRISELIEQIVTINYKSKYKVELIVYVAKSNQGENETLIKVVSYTIWERKEND